MVRIVYSPEQEKSANSTAAPPFGIGHWLILTSTIALCRGFTQAFYTVLQQSTEADVVQQPPFIRIIGGLAAVGNGLALSGSVWLLDWRRRRGRYILEPGHWILIGYSVSFLIFSPVCLAYFFVNDADSLSGSNWTIFVLQTIAPLTISIVASMAFFRTQGVRKWMIGTTLATRFFLTNFQSMGNSAAVQ